MKRKFVRNVITLASGTALAQIITLLCSPLITRLYGPEAFGLLGTFNSFLIILSTSITLTYSYAIVLPKKDEEAKAIAKLSLYIGLFLTIIIASVLALFGREIFEILNLQVLYSYMYLIPVVLLFTAGRQVAEQWLIRKKEFSFTAKISVFQSLILNFSKIAGGIVSPVGSTLIIIASLGQGIQMGLLMWGSSNTYFLKKRLSNSEQRYKKSVISLFMIGKRYLDFPLYRAPQVLLAAITQSMPVLLLSAFFGTISSGYYTLGITVLGLPSQIIGKAVGDVFYPRIAEAVQRKENIKNILLKATLLLALIGLIPFGLVILLGPILFSFVFGAEWEVAGIYASWIALWSYALFVSNPSIKTLSVISAQRFYLLYTILNTLLRGGTLLIGGLIFKSDILAVALFSISGAILSVVLTLVTISKSSNYYGEKNTDM